MNHADGLPEYVIAEYQAIREEVLLRLGAQQNLLYLAFLVLGVLAPVLGLSDRIPIGIVLLVLALGPLVCVFLQLIYLKHHEFMDLAAAYVTHLLGTDLIETKTLSSFQSHPLSGWERHLSQTYKSGKRNPVLRLLGYAEGGLLTLIGGIYLFAFVASLVSTQDAANSILKITDGYRNFLIALAVADFIGLAVALYLGIWIRRQVSLRRQAEVAEMGYASTENRGEI